MQIVIDLSSDTFTRLCHGEELLGHRLHEVFNAVKHGNLLPEHHGDLIDKKEVYKKFYCRSMAEVATEVLNEVNTIIPATDKTATWKRIGNDACGLIDMYECSNCGANPPKKQIGVSWGWDFVDCCPNCGSKIIPGTKEAKSCENCEHFIDVGDGWHQCDVDKVCGAHSEWTPKQIATKEGVKSDA